MSTALLLAAIGAFYVLAIALICRAMAANSWHHDQRRSDFDARLRRHGERPEQARNIFAGPDPRDAYETTDQQAACCDCSEAYR